MGMDGLELDERKTKILDAIIRNYLATGEPVGSRTISKYSDLNLSSATIRNEMSDLEELGYIFSPVYYPSKDFLFLYIENRADMEKCQQSRCICYGIFT